MTREEQINKAIENLLDEAEIEILDRPLLRMWCKIGVNFADKNPIDRTDWQQVRVQAAIAAMQGILGDYEYVQEIHYASPDTESMRKSVAELSVLYADALVKELKGE